MEFGLITVFRNSVYFSINDPSEMSDLTVSVKHELQHTKKIN